MAAERRIADAVTAELERAAEQPASSGEARENVIAPGRGFRSRHRPNMSQNGLIWALLSGGGVMSTGSVGKCVCLRRAGLLVDVGLGACPGRGLLGQK